MSKLFYPIVEFDLSSYSISVRLHNAVRYLWNENSVVHIGVSNDQ